MFFAEVLKLGKQGMIFDAEKTLARGEVVSDKIVDGHDGGSGLELLERSRWPALGRSLASIVVPDLSRGVDQDCKKSSIPHERCVCS